MIYERCTHARAAFHAIVLVTGAGTARSQATPIGGDQNCRREGAIVTS